MRRYSVFFIAIPAAAICVRLGLWQVSRLSERRALNAELRANQALQPVSLDRPLPELPRFRRLWGRGAWDYERQVIVEARSFDGAPAVIVTTPLVIGVHGVLVERGWVMSPDAKRVDLAALGEGDSATVEGLVVETRDEGRETGDTVATHWPRYTIAIHVAALSSLYPYRLLPYVVRRTNTPAVGKAVAKVLHPVPVPEPSNGPHLSYAIQWFAFALIALGGSVVLFRGDEGPGTRDE